MDSLGEWVTLAEASQRTGVSIQTLRRKLKKGKIESRQVETIYGPTWQVPLAQLSRVEGEASPQSQDSTNLELVNLVRDLHQENRELAETSSMWQERAQTLALHLSQAQEKILMLEAPKEEEPASKNGEEDNLLPWWRRWWQNLILG
jgi:hypothetical protein